MTEIASEAFHQTALRRVFLPAGLTTLRRRVFSECDKLATVILPRKLGTIEDEAFFFCRNMTEVYFPATLRSISSRCYTMCDKWTVVHFDGKPKQWDKIPKADGGLRNSRIEVRYKAKRPKA